MHRFVNWKGAAGLVGIGMLMSASATSAADMKKVAIATIVEVPQLVETKEGVIKGLAERGFVVGKNIEIDYQNSNGNMSTQQQVAKKFVGDAVDVIVPITTPTAQAMVTATKDIPIVFVAVTDPLKAKLIPQFKQPGGNVTGVSDAAPIAAQLKLFKQIVPNLKKLGFVYNPGLDSSKATLGWVQDQGKELGIEVVEAAAPTTNEVIPATNKLIGKVDAIYVPNDTTVVAALETIVKIGKDTKIPVFTGETRGVGRGSVASLGLNYTQVGMLTGHMVADVLEGKKPATMDAVLAYEKLPETVVVVNKGAAVSMGVVLSDAVLKQATQVIE
ncbi:MAG: ABC transporter substrate-binding protein [Bradyrhizobium sp.]|nr:ABC transporter substrate-binding protein [Bradyrhizobium sp.]